MLVTAQTCANNLLLMLQSMFLMVLGNGNGDGAGRNAAPIMFNEQSIRQMDGYLRALPDTEVRAVLLLAWAVLLRTRGAAVAPALAHDMSRRAFDRSCDGDAFPFMAWVLERPGYCEEGVEGGYVAEAANRLLTGLVLTFFTELADLKREEEEQLAHEREKQQRGGAVAAGSGGGSGGGPAGAQPLRSSLIVSNRVPPTASDTPESKKPPR
jgi:hypothetical protein